MIELAFYASIVSVFVGVALTGLILLVRRVVVGNAVCHLGILNHPELKSEVAEGETLLAALSDNAIAIPSPCGGKATCKQCKVKVVEGKNAPFDIEKDTFTRKQLTLGWRLSCQCKIKRDLVVEIDDHLLNVQQIEGTVISNHNVATFIKELAVQIPNPIAYRSGGYMQFHVPPFATKVVEWKETMDKQYWNEWEKWGFFQEKIDFSHLEEDQVVRAYSMASYPEEGNRLLFNIRIASPPLNKGKVMKNIPWGICSSYLFSLKPGDRIKLSGPYGESFMIDDQRELVFLIGGAGSSFGRSHIGHLLQTEKSSRKITLWYGARSLKENIYQEEYEQLDSDHSNFTYRLVLSEPQSDDIAAGWDKEDPVKTNYLFRAFELGQLKMMDEPEEVLYYVCGPPLHNKSVLELLDNYGVPRENIVLDDFGS